MDDKQTPTQTNLDFTSPIEIPQSSQRDAICALAQLFLGTMCPPLMEKDDEGE